MPVSERISVPLGRVEGKGYVPYVHPAKVAELEAEVERLRARVRANAPTPCNACGTSSDPTRACYAHSWHNAS